MHSTENRDEVNRNLDNNNREKYIINKEKLEVNVTWYSTYL